MTGTPIMWGIVLALLMSIISGCGTTTTEPNPVPSKTAADMSEARSTIEVPVEETSEATPILQVPGSAPTKAGDKVPAVIYEGISFSHDPAIASDVVTKVVPAADSEALGWSLGPTHVRFSFGDYVLPDTLYKPRILVYPVAEFEAISEYAAKTIADLRQLLVDRPAAPKAIPFLPPFNAEQKLCAQVAYVDFRDGAGVRSLVHYAQARVPVSNYELFYTFQGLTDDGNAYVAAILPVSHPDLPENYLAYDLDTFARTYDTYLVEIENQLNEQDASSFSPKLSQLDAMIESLEAGSPWSPTVPPATEGTDGTLTAQPAKTSMPTPTETRIPTPTRDQTSTWTPPTTEMPPPFTHTLKTYQGQGFSFQYPAGARLETIVPRRRAWQRTLPAISEVRVHGPGAWVRQCDGNWSHHVSSYMLIVRTYENPEGLDAEAWARDHLIAAWTRAKEQNRPRGGLPVSEDGEIEEDRVGSTVVAGQPAFWVSSFAFDSTDRAYYLSSDQQIVVLSFGLYPLANEPLAMVQGDVYALILGTLQLHN